MKAQADNSQEVQSNTFNSTSFIKRLTAFFDLLDQIDQRLMNEDEEYFKKYRKDHEN